MILKLIYLCCYVNIEYVLKELLGNYICSSEYNLINKSVNLSYGENKLVILNFVEDNK